MEIGKQTEIVKQPETQTTNAAEIQIQIYEFKCHGNTWCKNPRFMLYCVHLNNNGQ